MFSAADSMSASSNTTTGALPPSSRCTRLTSSAAALATAMPARTLPVIEAICGVGCLTSAAPVSRSPQTTLNTPSGKNSAITSAIHTELAGVVSDGLSTIVLPAANVLARGHALEHPRGAREEADLVAHRRDLLRCGQLLRLAGVLGLDVDEL